MAHLNRTCHGESAQLDRSSAGSMQAEVHVQCEVVVDLGACFARPWQVLPSLMVVCWTCRVSVPCHTACQRTMSSGRATSSRPASSSARTPPQVTPLPPPSAQILRCSKVMQACIRALQLTLLSPCQSATKPVDASSPGQSAA